MAYKNHSSFFTTLLICAVLSGCTKSPEPLTPEQQSAQNLVGNGNKTWHLQELYINGVQQTLTAQQKIFSKIYMLDPGMDTSGTLSTSEGSTGTWKLTSSAQLRETIIYPAGAIQKLYDVREMSQTRVDIQYTANLQTTREVYYAN